MDSTETIVLSYDYLVFTMAILIAFITSFSSLMAAHNLRRNKRSWPIIVGTTLGLGIWTSYYIAMAAVRYPIPISFEFDHTVMSISAITISSVVSFILFANDTGDTLKRSVATILLGGAIVGLHYLLMQANSIEAYLNFKPMYLLGSFFTAMFLSSFALNKIKTIVVDRIDLSGGGLISHSIILTLCTTLIHYLGMSALQIHNEIPLPSTQTLESGHFHTENEPTLLFGFVVFTLISIIAIVLKYRGTNEQTVEEFNEREEAISEFLSSDPEVELEGDTEIIDFEEAVARNKEREKPNDEENSILSEAETETASLTSQSPLEAALNSTERLQQANEHYQKHGKAEKLFNSAVSHIMDATNAELGTMVFLDKKGKIKKMVTKGVEGLTPEMVESLPGYQKLIGKGTTGASPNYKDIQDDSRFSGFNPDFPEISNLMIQPIKNEAGVQGLILLGNKADEPQFNIDDEAMASLYARDLVQILTNNQLKSKLRNTSSELEREKKEQLRLKKELKTTNKGSRKIDEANSIAQVATGVANQIDKPIKQLNDDMQNLDKQVGDLFNMLESTNENKTQQEAITTLKRDIKDLVDQSADRTQKVNHSLQEFQQHTQKTNRDWQLADLHQNIDNTLQTLGKEIGRKAKIRKRYGKLPPVECISEQLDQAFTNLIINAAQSIENTGMIEITSGVEKNNVWIKFLDTGRGIEQQHIDHLFDPFYTTINEKDVGLGLPQAYEAVRKHNGELKVESQVGIGTSITVILPISQGEQRLAS